MNSQVIMDYVTCIKLNHADNFIWLVSCKDKLYGEIVNSREATAKAQKYELKLNWLICDIVDANREKIEIAIRDREAKLQATVGIPTPENTEEAPQPELTYDQQDSQNKQILLESYVREAIASGGFGNPIFLAYRQELMDLLEENSRINRTFDLVKSGLMCRGLKSTDGQLPEGVTVTGDTAKIPTALIKSGVVSIGHSEAEFEGLVNNFWFGENLMAEIARFLMYEHAGKDYLAQKKLETLGTPSNDNSDNYPTGSEDETDDEKKLVGSVLTQ
jgi:hypothetical protein